MINNLDYQFRTYLQEGIILLGIFWILTIPLLGLSQSTGLADIPITVDNRNVPDPFSGGTLTPQYNQIDLDRDGVLDIVIFDRRGQILTPYLYNTSTATYDYSPEYRAIFPELNSLLLIRDYNFDGIPDIYTMDIFSNSNSMVVYKGSIIDNAYDWQIVEHAFEPIPYIYFERYGLLDPVFNLFVDKPDIVDVDGDGDLDILSFNSGGSSIDFYRNMTIEDGRDFDDHYYILQDDCFGGFIEGGNSSEIFLSDGPGECYSKLTEDNPVETRHAGSTITAFDEDGDGDMDLLIGDLVSNHLVLLRNGGSSELAWMNEVDETFPSYDVPVDFPVWQAAYLLDVDHNGTQDLVIGPNDLSNADNINNAWLYLNSSESAFDLTFEQNDFLKEHTLDLGDHTSPKFVDVDQDGLIDIICATRGDYNNNANDQARLIFFRNIGTATLPSYILEDDDFADMNQFIETSLEFHPGFGDLDSDGDIDMLVGDNNGFLYYFENTAGANNPLQFTNPIYQYMDIRPGTTSKPAVYDVDGDGLNDLVLGERNKNTNPITEEVGSLNFYRNIGEIGSPLFDPNILAEGNWPNLGNVVGEAPGAGNASSSPVFYDSDDGTLLFVGTRIGDIQVYGGDLSQVQSSYDTLSLTLGNIYEGRNSVIDIADIDSDGWLEMVVGNERGGLALFDTTVEAATGEIFSSTDNQTSQSTITIYPNPTSGIFTIDSEVPIDAVTIYTQLGQVVSNQDDNNLSSRIDLRMLQTGLYVAVIRLSTGETVIKYVSKL